MSIVVREVSKSYGASPVVDRVSLEIPTGRLTALLGPSGSGKTTLLRIIAGLEKPDAGQVYLRDREATGASARERNVGFVFQHYALFKHMNVRDNVGFALRMRRRPREEIRGRVEELLSLVQLTPYGGFFPHRLSGGQRQRVALARALAASPEVLLLDEPFGALDAMVRKDLRAWLRGLIERIGVTSIFVTHDQEEALEVADRIVVMNRGRIEQHGSPKEVFEHPANPFVMTFLGQVNIFRGRIARTFSQSVSSSPARSPRREANDGGNGGGRREEPAEPVGYVRPHELAIERNGDPHGVPSVVRQVAWAGPRVRIDLESTEDGRILVVDLTHQRAGELELRPGERVWVIPREMRIFLEDYSI